MKTLEKSRVSCKSFIEFPNTLLKENTPVAVVSSQGERTEAKLQEGRLTIKLTAAPKYIALDKAALIEDPTK